MGARRRSQLGFKSSSLDPRVGDRSGPSDRRSRQSDWSSRWARWFFWNETERKEVLAGVPRPVPLRPGVPDGGVPVQRRDWETGSTDLRPPGVTSGTHLAVSSPLMQTRSGRSTWSLFRGYKLRIRTFGDNGTTETFDRENRDHGHGRPRSRNTKRNVTNSKKPADQSYCKLTTKTLK